MKSKKIENRGGSRSKAGRKPLPATERKETVLIYLKQKEIDFLGGKPAVIQLINNYFEKIFG